MIVLDTSALLAGFDPFSLGLEQVTVPKVEDEIIIDSMPNMRFKTAVESGKIKVVAPSEEFLNQVQASSSKVGDSYLLSETDKHLLALALEYKAKGYSPQLVTDDYSIQNVAKQLGIDFLALATFGIKRLLNWIRYCPACHKEYPINSTFKECQVCGTPLKRKPRKMTKRIK